MLVSNRWARPQRPCWCSGRHNLCTLGLSWACSHPPSFPLLSSSLVLVLSLFTSQIQLFFCSSASRLTFLVYIPLLLFSDLLFLNCLLFPLWCCPFLLPTLLPAPVPLHTQTCIHILFFASANTLTLQRPSSKVWGNPSWFLLSLDVFTSCFTDLTDNSKSKAPSPYVLLPSRMRRGCSQTLTSSRPSFSSICTSQVELRTSVCQTETNFPLQGQMVFGPHPARELLSLSLHYILSTVLEYVCACVHMGVHLPFRVEKCIWYKYAHNSMRDLMWRNMERMDVGLCGVHAWTEDAYMCICVCKMCFRAVLKRWHL